MSYKELIKKTETFLIGLGVTGIAGAIVLMGCMGNNNVEHDQEAGGIAVTVSQGIGERPGDETRVEHKDGSEGAGNEGAEGSGARGTEEITANQMAPDQTFDTVRSGARLIMNYDPATNSFKGTVENITNGTLTRVRVEVHLSNGTELGPTTPIDLAPGQTTPITLASTQASFNGWVAHAEVGNSEGGHERSEGSHEGGSDREINEAAMSSPIIPLDQTWQGDLGPLAINARYEAATQSVISTMRNTDSQAVCYVQAEPHLKSGTTTVGELGPDKLGDLSPGQTATTNVRVANEPALADVAFDGYVVHMEVFDCAGPGPQPHPRGEGAEGAGGESGGEHGGRGEGRGSG